MTLSLLWAIACSSAPPLPDLGKLPDFALVDQSGAVFGQRDLLGRVWVADFMFTSCPDICPVLSAHMAEIQTHYAADERVNMVSISVDPGTDTPEVLTKYAARFGANNERWHFLTGETSAVRTVVRDGFKMVMEPGEKPANILHGERFVVVDQTGHIRAYPDPKEPGKAEIYRAVDQLLTD